MLRRLGGAALLAACAYTTADAAADSLMYMRAKSLIQEQAESNARFLSEVGSPLQLGPWYNSSVSLSHDGHIAAVTIPVRGSKRSSDVTVRVVRKGGLRSTLLHNAIGGGEWDVVVMNAMIGMGPGGIPISMSLLQQHEPDMQAAAAAATDAVGAAGQPHCLPCAQQQHAGQAQQQATQGQ